MTPSHNFPHVSVVVNTYNQERFIAQALRSVIAQDFPADAREIIVVDDGSQDGTPQQLREFSSLIRYIRQDNAGQVSAFNTGVAAARGEILAFLDGDDWWEPSKLTKIIAAFDANPEVSAVGHGYFEVNEHGLTTATMSPEHYRRLGLESPSQARESAPFRIFLGTSRLAIRRSILKRAMPVPPELPFFDNFVFSQAIAISGAVVLPEPLCYYRIHSGSLYVGDAVDQKRLWKRYGLLCGLLEHLPVRLTQIGVTEDAICAFLESDIVDRDRLKLILLGGKRSETFRVERSAFRISYSNPTIGYRCFKALTFLMALVLAPKAFYKVHDWYAKHGLRRVRQWIGNASPSLPQVARRSVKGDVDSTRA